MGFTEAVRSGFKNLWNFDGRATRPEFWHWVLVSFLAYFGLIFTVGWVAASLGLYQEFNLLVLLGIGILGLSVTVRRLHDVGKAGWWILISAVPLGVLYALYLYVQPSDTTANSYGPSPSAPATVAR
jgi:uncharacterized membrane protein YhaH (DUF805 family)